LIYERLPAGDALSDSLTKTENAEFLAQDCVGDLNRKSRGSLKAKAKCGIRGNNRGAWHRFSMFPRIPLYPHIPHFQTAGLPENRYKLP
jgi:hypothetical protein